MARRPVISEAVRRERLADVRAERMYLERMERRAEQARAGLRAAIARADTAGLDFASIAEASGWSVSTVQRAIRKVRRGL